MMTLAEKMGRKRPDTIPVNCQFPDTSIGNLADELRPGDEVVVFRRDPETGEYTMFTACCEAILPPLVPA